MSVSNSIDAPASSALLKKARALGLDLPLDLERMAIARGCRYYERDLGSKAAPAISEAEFSNEELAIALISPGLSPSAREIRLAAALLGAADINPKRVAALATQEDCAMIVRYIAECGKRYEPENMFWDSLLSALPSVVVNPDGLPHPTRFIEMTGMIRGKVGLFTSWVRPCKLQAA